MELEMGCLTLRRLLQKVCSFAATNVSSAPTYEHFPVFNAGLSQDHMMAGQKERKSKEKVPDVLDSNQNVETRGHSKLKFT